MTVLTIAVLSAGCAASAPTASGPRAPAPTAQQSPDVESRASGAGQPSQPESSNAQAVGQQPEPAAPQLAGVELLPDACNEWDLDADVVRECWLLRVPQGPGDPLHVRLPVTLTGHTKASPAPDPVLLITRWAFLDRFADDTAIVHMVARGGPDAASTSCDEVWALPLQDATEQCVQRLEASGFSIDRFAAPIVAEDALHLRQSLEIESWRVVIDAPLPVDATRLAGAIAALDPTGVESIVIRPNPRSDATPNEALTVLQEAVRAAITACEADTACAERYPAVRADLQSLLAGEQELGLTAYTSPLGGPSPAIERELTTTELLVTLGRAITSNNLFSLLPALGEEAVAGGGPLFDALPQRRATELSIWNIAANCVPEATPTLTTNRVDGWALGYSKPIVDEIESIGQDRCTGAPEPAIAPRLAADTVSTGNSPPVLLHATAHGEASERNALRATRALAQDWMTADRPGVTWVFDDCASEVEEAFWRGESIADVAADACDAESRGFWLGDSPEVGELIAVESTWEGTTLAAIVPDNWEQYGAQYFERNAHGLDSASISFDWWTETNPDELIEWQEVDYGWTPDDRADLATRVVADREWQLTQWSSPFDTSALTLAVAAFDDRTVSIELWSQIDEAAELIESVLVPALGATLVNEGSTPEPGN